MRGSHRLVIYKQRFRPAPDEGADAIHCRAGDFRPVYAHVSLEWQRRREGHTDILLECRLCLLETTIVRFSISAAAGASNIRHPQRTCGRAGYPAQQQPNLDRHRPRGWGRVAANGKSNVKRPKHYLAVPLAQLPTLIDYLCEVSSPGEFSPDRATEKPTSRYAGGIPTAA